MCLSAPCSRHRDQRSLLFEPYGFFLRGRVAPPVVLGGNPSWSVLEAPNHHSKLLLLLLWATRFDMSLLSRCNYPHTTTQLTKIVAACDDGIRGLRRYLEASMDRDRVKIRPAFVSHTAKLTIKLNRTCTPNTETNDISEL